MDKWNRCNECGQFIAYQEFVDGTAKNVLVTPSAYGTEEVWDTYHIKCRAKDDENSHGSNI